LRKLSSSFSARRISTTMSLALNIIGPLALGMMLLVGVSLLLVGCTEPPTDDTQSSGEGLIACFFPIGSERFSLITKGNATVHAHDVYSGIAIGGSLFDGSPNEHGGISRYCPDCQALIAGDCATAACGDAPTFTGGTFKFHGQAPVVGSLSQVNVSDKFREFEDLARTVRTGIYPGAEGCDKFRVHVSNVGGQFSMNDFCTKKHGCNPEDNGCTLVVFNTSDRIVLNKDVFGRQFGPSVLAPFSEVTLLETAGYIDGFLVAESFGGDAGPRAGSLQMHGNIYKGQLWCVPTTTTTTTTTTTPTTTNTTNTTTDAPFTTTAATTSALERPETTKLRRTPAPTTAPSLATTALTTITAATTVALEKTETTTFRTTIPASTITPTPATTALPTTTSIPDEQQPDWCPAACGEKDCDVRIRNQLLPDKCIHCTESACQTDPTWSLTIKYDEEACTKCKFCIEVNPNERKRAKCEKYWN